MNRLSLPVFVATAVIIGSVTAGADASPANCSPTTFISAARYPAGPYPLAIATGDFNNDTKVDLVTANYNDSSVTVLPGNGDGTFDPPISSPGSFNPAFVVTGYFDTDTNLDLALASSYGGAISVLLGNGDGTFQAPTSYAAAYFATGLVAADLDGDGALDLAETDSYGSEIYILLGNGDGTFGAATTVSTPASPVALAVGDFHTNGKLDLAVPLGSNAVAVFPGNGDGTFGSPTMLKVGPNLHSVVVADLSSDGHPDIAVFTDTLLAIFRGNGDGTFQAAFEYPVGPYPVALLAADLDGDGKLDIAALKQPGYVTQILLQQDDGSFASGPAYLTGSVTLAFVAADFDGDGNIDLACANSGDNTVSTLMGLGGGRLEATTAVAIPWQPRFLTAGDFTSDGVSDLVSIGPNYDGPVNLFVNTADAGFKLIASLSVVGSPVSATAADFDGDGRLDLAVATFSSGFLVFHGDGDGTFGAPASYTTPGQAQWIVSGDLSGDGVPDIALTDTSFVGNEVSIFINNGDGTFQPAISSPLDHAPSQLLVDDLSQDGKLDLATANGVFCCPTSDTVSVLLGNGNGTFQPPADHATGPGPQSLASGDFDEDGHRDLIVADAFSTNISLLLGDGSGTFGPPTLIGIGWSPVFVAVGDFDGDGHLDVVTANQNGYRLSLLLGTGDGGFQLPATYVTAAGPGYLAVANLDGGTTPDVAVANFNDYYLSVFLNARLSVSPLTNTSVLIGSPAVLRASASGFGPLTYQWRKNGVPLSDGGSISGATTATLTIDPAAFTDAGSYDVIVTDSCTSVTSNAAILSVEFADVPPSNIFHDDIITIATAGITAGCGGSNYCPDLDVSRAQMAVLLLKAKFGAGHVPPPPPPLPIFADVPANAFAAAWIDELASLGITGGCGNGNYCPDDPVTRAQMAVLLLKTLLGSGYTPPTAVGIFEDVAPGDFAADWIEDLYNRQITGGCNANPLRYCPGVAVSRGQMATLIVRTFLLP